MTDPFGGLPPAPPAPRVPPPGRPSSPATYGLLLVLFAMFGAELALSGDFSGESSYALTRLGSLVSYAVRDGDFWRVGSYAFLHIGWLHILTNAWAIWVLMPQVELAFGTTLAVGFFSATAIAGGATSFGWAVMRGHEVSAAGASGGAFGLFGATMALMFRLRHRFSPAQRSAMRRQIFINLLLNGYIALQYPVDNAAHLGGLFSGIALGLLVPQRSLPAAVWQRPAKWLAVLGIVVLACLEGAALGRAVKPKPRTLRGPGVTAAVDPVFVPVAPGEAQFPGRAALWVRREDTPFAIEPGEELRTVAGREWLRTAGSSGGVEHVVLETADGAGTLFVELFCNEEFCRGGNAASVLEPTLRTVRAQP